MEDGGGLDAVHAVLEGERGEEEQYIAEGEDGGHDQSHEGEHGRRGVEDQLGDRRSGRADGMENGMDGMVTNNEKKSEWKPRCEWCFFIREPI